MLKPAFMGVFYLEGKFANRLPEYFCNNQEIMLSFQPSMAFGFWPRRGIEGSSDEFWNGLSAFIMKYDTKWLEGKKI